MLCADMLLFRQQTLLNNSKIFRILFVTKVLTYFPPLNKSRITRYKAAKMENSASIKV